MIRRCKNCEEPYCDACVDVYRCEDCNRLFCYECFAKGVIKPQKTESWKLICNDCVSDREFFKADYAERMEAVKAVSASR